MEKKSTEVEAFFEDTDRFIRNVDAKRVTPPFITNDLRTKRRDAFKSFKKYIGNLEQPKESENMMMFINKFEMQYVEELREKLKDRYIDHIIQKKYDLPNEVNLRDIKKLGALNELSTLAVAIAEWSLELEILAYNLEGLSLYGFKTYKNNFNPDFLTIFKKEYSYKSSRSLKSISQYLVQRLINFSLRKFSSLAIAKGFSKVQLGGRVIWEIFFAFSVTNKIPWELIIKYLNLPWLVGGFATSYLVGKLGDYVAKEEVVANLETIESTFENNKIFITNNRKTLFDEMLKLLVATDKSVREEQLKKISILADKLLEPQLLTSNDPEETVGDIDKYYNIKELEDCVLIEEKDFKEYVDETGVVIIE